MAEGSCEEECPGGVISAIGTTVGVTSQKIDWGCGRVTGVAAVETGQAVSMVTTMCRAVSLTEAVVVRDWRQLSDLMAGLNCALGPPAQVELEEGQKRN